MNIIKSAAVVISGFAMLSSVSISARAASANTEVFLANVTANVDFLDRSSRMALENSKSVKIKDFARGEATEQTLAANAIYDVTAKAPLQTGRSVALSGQPEQVDLRLPMGQEDLDSIEGLSGIEFDEAFRAKQRDALTQVQTDYETYLASGDDDALKSIAKQELPKIKKQIAALSKV